jgi:hypothetical protein
MRTLGRSCAFAALTANDVIKPKAMAASLVLTFMVHLLDGFRIVSDFSCTTLRVDSAPDLF